MSATKAVAGDFRVAGTVTYEITFSNSSEADQPDNPGDEFVDDLPDQLTLIDRRASRGNRR